MEGVSESAALCSNVICVGHVKLFLWCLMFFLFTCWWRGTGGGEEGEGGESAALSSAGWMLKIWLICSDLVELFIWCLFFLHTGLGGAGCFVGFYLSVQWEECKICVGAWRAFILLDCSCWCWMFFYILGNGGVEVGESVLSRQLSVKRVECHFCVGCMHDQHWSCWIVDLEQHTRELISARNTQHNKKRPESPTVTLTLYLACV